MNTSKATLFASVDVPDLVAYIERHRQHKDGFNIQFQSLPQPEKSCDIANSPANREKNRYNNLCPYDCARIVLHNPPNGSTDYINASYIGGYNDPYKKMYIATQGPRGNTVADFWHMVWQEGSNIIVMLTATEDASGKSVCDYYWPCEETSSPDQMTFGEVTVKLEAEESMSEMFIRQLRVSCQGDVKTVHQFQYTGWESSGDALLHPTSLLDFRRRVEAQMHKRTGPVVVHGSAGVGRTGVYIAVDALLQQMNKEPLINVYDFVCLMREQRTNMIQTQAQYTFIYDVLFEAVLSGNTACSTIPAGNTACSGAAFRARFTELLEDFNISTEYDNPSSEIGEQFERLSELRKLKDDEAFMALRKKDKDKNRNHHIIPSNDVRPQLSPIQLPGCTDYINAVYINGFKQSNAFILTQMPLENTIADLWRLLYEHRSHSILTLENDSMFPSYWPNEEGTPLTFGHLTINLVYTIEEDGIRQREFTITSSKTKHNEPLKVRQFQLIYWPRDIARPDRASVLCEALEKIQNWQKVSADGPITIQCIDGAERSGLVCTLVYVLEKLKVDHEIDVFNAVKHVRISWPHAVKSLDQYIFLHELVQLSVAEDKEYTQLMNVQ